MTVALETLINRSLRNIGDVEPFVKERAVEIIRRAYAEGIFVQFSSGYRSFAEQDELYAKGRTAPGNKVTNARAGQSVHNYGLALDYFLVSSDGNNAIWNVTSEWRRVAEIGKELGFSWGGDWRSFKDYPHLEYTQGLTWRDLKAGKRPRVPSPLRKEAEAVAEGEETQVASSWAKEAQAWVKEAGISSGTRPKDKITREEVWTMIWRALKR